MRNYSRITISLAVISSLILALPQSVSSEPVLRAGQGPLTETVGYFLHLLTDQLQQVVDSARNAGLSVEIEGGREANIALQNAQNAYEESLNVTIDKAGALIEKNLNSLKSIVDEVSSGLPIEVADISSKSQQLINSLPFRPHEPQLTKGIAKVRCTFTACLTSPGRFSGKL